MAAGNGAGAGQSFSGIAKGAAGSLRGSPGPRWEHDHLHDRTHVFGGLGQLSVPASVAPFATAGGGFLVTQLPILAFTFPSGGIQTGVYRIFAGLFHQGALADNTWNDGDLVC